MLNLGLLAFTQPWLLVALAALPALWLLLRITPPAPRRLSFPALRLLLRLDAREETPARTPWWLLLLRLTIAALLILALAGPVLNPQPRLAGNGPLLLVIDDGWAAAPGWTARIAQLETLLAQAEREGRAVHVLRTAPDEAGRLAIERSEATPVRESLVGWQPRPWPVDRTAALAVLSEEPAGATVIWLSDGIARSSEDAAAAGALATRLAEIGTLRVIGDPPADLPPLLLPPDLAREGLAVEAVRPAPGPALRRDVRALGPGGEVLARGSFAFEESGTRATAVLDIPTDLRNRIARLELQPRDGIGAVVLLDERWRRRAVGIVGRQYTGADQPLLSDVYFLERALAPFAGVRTGELGELLDGPLSLMVLPDIGRLGAPERERLEAWIDKGGVLLRFAGPRLATASDDPLLPVPLRAGDRQLGGVLSWSEPLAIGRFSPQGPFAGLVPNDEARISRQVLAEPGPGVADATFASLVDGTPLVTGRRIGEGWLVLVHTTANTSWSSLPLSGLFVEMLRRIVALAPGAGTRPTGTLEAQAVLDAFGLLQDAQAGVGVASAESFAELLPGPLHPPGLYAPAGEATGGTEVARVALNLQEAIPDPSAIGPEAIGRAVEGMTRGREVDPAPWLLLAALILAFVDLVVGYALRGLIPRLTPAATAALTLAVLSGSAPAAAQGGAVDQQRSMAAALETRLAYVTTGRRDVDESSRAGLVGLGRVLGQRTSIETGEPVGIDVATDELAVYPFIYWPVPSDHPELAADTVDRIEAYLRQGGLILFDTKDAGLLLPGQQGGGPGEARLGQILRGIDLPALVPVPPDHVLTRSFYLLQDFPGRWTGQPLWVDQVPAAINDGVSSVVIGANDWAGAWAVDDYGQSLLPVVPGGEAQREMARRFGVNLLMYALTGNYKTDQVHVPALLERLGQ